MFSKKANNGEHGLILLPPLHITFDVLCRWHLISLGFTWNLLKLRSSLLTNSMIDSLVLVVISKYLGYYLHKICVVSTTWCNDDNISTAETTKTSNHIIQQKKCLVHDQHENTKQRLFNRGSNINENML